MNKRTISGLSLAIWLFFSTIATALADPATDVLRLQQRWEEVNYQLEGKTRLTAFEDLIADAKRVAKQYPDNASVWIWNGIIKSTYAGAKGGLGALKFAKASRADLEKALKIDPNAMQGSAYTSLGTLYYNVPGWPVGFGDEEKAEQLMLKGLALNPKGIDSNYFFGTFLLSEQRYKESEAFLLTAQAAPARPGRPVADAGRQKEIAEALSKVRAKLNK